MNKEIIIKYNNVTYTLWLNKDIKICCHKETDNKFVKGLNEEDKKIIKDVINSLIVDPKESLFIAKGNNEEKEYKVYLDKKNNIYYVDTFDNKIISNINISLNSSPEIIYQSDEYKKEENKKYIKFLNKGNLIITIPTMLNALIFSILIGFHGSELKDIVSSLFPNYVSETDLEISDEILLEEVIESKPKEVKYEINYSFDYLLDVLKRNPNVDDEFIEYFSKLEFVFTDNSDNIKIDENLLNKAKSLSVKYTTEKNNRAKGTYNRLKNEITYYDAGSVGELGADTLYHEIGHFLQNITNYSLFLEISNEIWTRETLKKLVDNNELPSTIFIKENIFGTLMYGTGYDDKLDLYYYLMDLMETDDVRNYQWNNNDISLIKAVCGTKKEDIELRKSFRELLLLLNNYKAVDDEEYKSFDNDQEGYKELLNIVNDIYVSKKGYNLDESIINFAFREIVFSSDDELNKTIIPSLYQEGMFVYYLQEPKSYFSDDYKNIIHCKILDGKGKLLGIYDIEVNDELKERYTKYIINKKQKTKQKTHD